MEAKTGRGVTFGCAKPSEPTTADFRFSHAVVIGIDDYGNGIPRLTTAVNDATRLAEVLSLNHGYRVTLLTHEITRERLIRLLERKRRLTRSDRLLFYFAGHGIALHGDDGPQGYLVLQDSRADDPGSLLPMTVLHDALSKLSCRHFLAILDCCFAGAFRWSGATRDMPRPPRLLHREHYERYVRHRAWQALTSAAHDQEALDVISGKVLGWHGEVGEEGHKHSPFARALFDGLLGAADLVPARGDGIVTATELYLYLRQTVEGAAERIANHDQTPGIWPLRLHDKGEYVFLVPGKKTPNLPPAPKLTNAANPYRGLEPYGAVDAPLFFGRSDMTMRLAHLVEKEPLVIVVGASGSGKSSLVNAGLIPLLVAADKPQGPEMGVDTGKALAWHILGPMHPGATPLASLERLLRRQLLGADGQSLGEHAALGPLVSDWLQTHPELRLLLILDQFEEVVTQCRDQKQRRQVLEQFIGLLEAVSGRLHLVLTLRLDFEPLVREMCARGHWTDQRRFIVTPMSNDELREAIEQPAAERVLYFEPPSLVQRLVDDVQHTPAALPLVSFTLRELYRLRDPDNRALTETTYNNLGGIVGSLRKRADEEYEALEPAERASMRWLLLRMVAFEGGELTRRRVFSSELTFSDAAENARIATVLARLTETRLIVSGTSENPWGEAEAHWDLAHDKLLVAWDRLREWYGEMAEALPLVRRVAQSAGDWDREIDQGKKTGLLWDDDPRLPAAGALLLSASDASPAESGGLRQSIPRDSASSAIAKFWQSLFPDLRFPADRFVLNRLESQFVADSLRRKRDKLRKTTAAIAATMIILGGVGSVANWQRLAAERQERTAVWERLVAERQRRVAMARLQASQTAIAQKNGYHIRALLLATEAVKRPWELDRVRLGNPESILRELLTSTGGILLRGGVAAAFGPEGRWLATRGKGSVVRVYDLDDPSAKPLTLPGQHLPLTFHPYAGWLVTGGRDGKVRLWDPANPNTPSKVLPGHTDWVSALAFDPKGRWLASGSIDGTVLLRDPEDLTKGVLKRLPGHKGGVTILVFDTEGRFLASGGRDGKVCLWNIERSSTAADVLHCHEGPVTTLAFDPNGRWLAAAGEDGKVHLWDPNNPTAIPGVLPGPDFITTLAFDRYGFRLVTASSHTGYLWNLASLRDRPAVLWSSYGGVVPGLKDSHVTTVAFHPEDDRIVIAAFDGTVRLVHPLPPHIDGTVLRGHDNTVFKLTFGPKSIGSAAEDGWLLTQSEFDDTARLWDYSNPTSEPVALPGPIDDDEAFFPYDESSGSAPLAFDPAGSWLATAGTDGTVCLHDLDDPSDWLEELHDYEGSVRGLAFDPLGRWLAASGDKDNGTVRLWNLAQLGERSLVLPGQTEGGVTALVFDRMGRWLAAGGDDGKVRLWDPANPSEVPEVLADGQGTIASLAFDPKGRWLAAGGDDGEVRLWDPANPSAVPEVLADGQGTIASLAFDSKGRWLAFGGDEDAVRLWDPTKTSEKPRVLPGCPDGGVAALAFDPEGHWLAIGGKNGRLCLWEWENPSAKPVAIPIGHEGHVQTLAFDSKGHWLATSNGSEVRLLDPANPNGEAIVLSASQELVESLAFDPEGRWLATGNHFDHTARLWRLDIESLVDVACQIAGRNLTLYEWQQYLGSAPHQDTCPQFPSGADLDKIKVEEQASAPGSLANPPQSTP